MQAVLDARLNVRWPAHLRGAVEAGASKRRLQVSDYVREAVLARLIVEGVVSREQVEWPADAACDPDLAPGQWRHEWLRERGLV